MRVGFVLEIILAPAIFPMRFLWWLAYLALRLVERGLRKYRNFIVQLTYHVRMLYLHCRARAYPAPPAPPPAPPPAAVVIPPPVPPPLGALPWFTYPHD